MTHTIFTNKQLSDASGIEVDDNTDIQVHISEEYAAKYPAWKLTTFRSNDHLVIAWPDVSAILIRSNDKFVTLLYRDMYPRQLMSIGASFVKAHTPTPLIHVLDKHAMDTFPKEGKYIINSVEQIIEHVNGIKPATLIHVVATTKDGLIGIGDKLPWKRFKEDLQFFKAKTVGKNVMMGRKTVESIPGKLPDRNIIMVSRSDIPELKGRYDVHHRSIYDVMKGVGGVIFVAGGQQMYEQTLEDTSIVYRNIIHAPLSNINGHGYYYPILELEDHFTLINEEDTIPDEDGRYMTKQIWIAK